MAPAEIGVQVDDLGIEAGEDEAAVGLHARDPLEPKLVEVQPARVGVAVRHAFELALGVERPGVVEAGEHLGGARILPAHQCAAMRARVVEHVDVPAVHAADHEDRPTRQRPAHEVARARGSPTRGRRRATTWRKSAAISARCTSGEVIAERCTRKVWLIWSSTTSGWIATSGPAWAVRFATSVLMSAPGSRRPARRTRRRARSGSSVRSG